MPCYHVPCTSHYVRNALQDSQSIRQLEIIVDGACSMFYIFNRSYHITLNLLKLYLLKCPFLMAWERCCSKSRKLRTMLYIQTLHEMTTHSGAAPPPRPPSPPIVIKLQRTTMTSSFKMLMVLCTLFMHITITPTRQKIHLIWTECCLVYKVYVIVLARARTPIAWVRVHHANQCTTNAHVIIVRCSITCQLFDHG